jgi:photosystem II stability/assembly factor-like uncharacterized protein
MKIFFPLVLVIIGSNFLFPQATWIKLNSPTSLRIEKLFCIDSLNCWAAGDSGLIIHTSNGGLNWTIQNSGVSEKIQDIFFLNYNLGWAVSARFDSVFGSYIIRTTNGGTHWEKELFNIENKFFHTIYFLDSLNGWVAGSPSQAFYGTTNGGLTWDSPRLNGDYSTLPVQKILFFSKQYGFACGGMHDLMGVIWKTTNAGLNWSAKNMGFEPLRELYFIDSLNLIGVGGDSDLGTGVARTSDGGENWIYELPGFLGAATGLSFRNMHEAWGCLGSESKFILSSDSGKTWISFGTYNNAAIFDLVFTDSLHGFAVGDSGVILQYKYNHTSTIDDRKGEIPLTLYISQNYPNPFNPRTKIRYEIPNFTLSEFEGSRVQLKVYDLLGNEVATLVDDVKPAGYYEVEFGASLNDRIISSGIYIYQIRVSNFIQTKKMLLLK